MLISSGGMFFSTATKTQTQTVKVYVLTRHDSSLYLTVEEAFKQSSYAPKDIDFDLVFQTQGIEVWKDIIDNDNTYVAWGGGPTIFDELLQDGYLEPITDSNILSEVKYLRQNEWTNDSIAGSPMFRNGTGTNSDKIYWVGSAIASFGFTVCSAVLEQLNLEVPRRWETLAHPNYYYDNPIIAIGSSEGSTSNTRIYQIILQVFGWQLGWGILSMIAGNALITEGSTGAKRAVEECNVAIANTIDFYGFDAQLETLYAYYILPENESIVNPDPIALTKNGGDSNKLKVANAFVNFVLSAEGQAVLLHNNIKRMPIRSDAFDNVPNTDDYSNAEHLRDLYNATIHNQGIAFNETLALSYLNSMIYYWEATLNDAHNELRDVMKSAKNAYEGGKLSEKQLLKLAYALGSPVGDPPFTEDYAQQINSQIGSDEGFRTQKRSEWKTKAKAKYQNLKSQLDSITTGTDFGISDNDIANISNPWEGYVPGTYVPLPPKTWFQTGAQSSVPGTGGEKQGLIPGFEALVVLTSFAVVMPFSMILKRYKRRSRKKDI